LKTDTAHIDVCLGPECRGHGGPELLSGLKHLGIDAERGHCRGLCIYMPVAHIDNHCIPEASVEAITSEIDGKKKV
jgi:NADH:ubiquinone oxidoreductase subunit E